MASKVPVTRYISWPALVLQFVILWLIMIVYTIYGITEPIYAGAATYLVLSIGLKKWVFGRYHSKGMRLVKQEKFLEAVPWFEKSFDYFTRHRFVERYRYLLLLSASRYSYRELALCNIGFCYSQSGDGPRAKEYYQRTLHEFPDNGLAKAALRMLTAFEKRSDE